MKTRNEDLGRRPTRVQPVCLPPFSSINDSNDRCVAEVAGTYRGEGWGLALFRPWHAPTIARWVRTEQELRWLAPSTPPPLTAEKIVGWKKPDGAAFVLVKGGERAPWGYGEINRWQDCEQHVWLGHVIVRPDQRGRGLGGLLLRALLDEAFERRKSMRVALIVFPDNYAALRCYRRGGFNLSGEEHHQFGHTGPTHRLLRLEIARAEYLSSIQASYHVDSFDPLAGKGSFHLREWLSQRHKPNVRRPPGVPG